jgi:hypothetical protein
VQSRVLLKNFLLHPPGTVGANQSGWRKEKDEAWVPFCLVEKRFELPYFRERMEVEGRIERAAGGKPEQSQDQNDQYGTRVRFHRLNAQE